MQIKAKYFISIFLAFVILLGTSAIISAAELRMSDTNKVTVLLTFSGTTANCNVVVTGDESTTSITDGYLALTDSSGTVIDDWDNLSSSTGRLSVYKTVSGLTKDETYTLTFSAKVNGKNGSEIISGSVSKTCK